MENEARSTHDSWNLQYQANFSVTSHNLKNHQLNFHLYYFRIREMALMAVWFVYVPYSLGFMEAHWLKAMIHTTHTGYFCCALAAE